MSQNLNTPGGIDPSTLGVTGVRPDFSQIAHARGTDPSQMPQGGAKNPNPVPPGIAPPPNELGDRTGVPPEQQLTPSALPPQGAGPTGSGVQGQFPGQSNASSLQANLAKALQSLSRMGNRQRIR